MEKVMGIDLGTSNSVGAVVDPFTQRGECIVNDEGMTLTASAICFENRDDILIGNIARDCSILYPETTAILFKRLMGVETTAITVDGKAYSPQQLSALVLKKIKADAEAELGQEVKKVVITVPAYFDSNRRQATKEAGMEAGFEVLDLLDEPVAALYCADRIMNYAGKTVLIFDLGGGTLDLVCAKITDDTINEIAISGDTYLGGSDWDKAFVSYITDTYLKGVRMEIEDRQELVNKTEKAKNDLSKKEETRFTVMTEVGRKEITVTRKEFEKCTLHLRDCAMNFLEEMKSTLEDKGITKLDQIILCGGATRMPQIQEGIKKVFPDTILVSKDVDQCVAKGAAIYAESLLKEKQPKIMRDMKTSDAKEVKEVKTKQLNRVTGRSYGIAAYIGDTERKVCNMIFQNMELPAFKESVYYTRHHNQKTVSLEVYESTASNRYENFENASNIGTCQLKINGDIPKGSPIIVSISIRTDGTLQIKGAEETGSTDVVAVMETNTLLSAVDLKEEKKAVNEIFVKVV